MIYAITLFSLTLIFFALYILAKPSHSAKKAKEIQKKINSRDEAENDTEIMAKWRLKKFQSKFFRKITIIPPLAIVALALTGYPKEYGAEAFIANMVIPLFFLTAILLSISFNIRRCPACRTVIGSARPSPIDTPQYIKYHYDPVNCPNCRAKLRD